MERTSIIPDFHPYFVEVSDLGAAALERVSEYTRHAIAALRYYRSRSEADIAEAIALSQQSPRLKWLSDRSLYYLLEMSTEGERPTIVKVAERVVGKEAAMTALESILKEGREQGVKQGMLNDRREVIIRQLSKKFGITDEEKSLIERTEDLVRLAAALDEFAVADTKQQVLSNLKPGRD